VPAREDIITHVMLGVHKGAKSEIDARQKKTVAEHTTFDGGTSRWHGLALPTRGDYRVAANPTQGARKCACAYILNIYVITLPLYIYVCVVTLLQYMYMLLYIYIPCFNICICFYIYTNV